MGDSLAEGGISGLGSCNAPRIITATGMLPVVAWIDASSGIAQTYIKQFDGTGWVELGSGSAAGGGVSNSASDISGLAAATDGTKVAVAWTAATGKDTKVFIAEYSAGSWTALTGSAGLGTTGLASTSPSLAYLDGTLFAAWEQVTQPEVFDREAYVARYNSTGGAWEEAGSGSMSGSGVSASAGLATGVKLAAGGGALHIAWANSAVIDGQLQQTAIYTKAWNGSAFAEVLPDSAEGIGIGQTLSETASVALSVDSSGHPFVAWQETGEGASFIYVRGNTLDAARAFTADGATSIQAILDGNDLGAGDVIIVQSGVHTGSVTIDAGDSGVVIYGAPGAVIAGSVVVQEGADGVTIQRVRIDGDLTVRDRKSVV
jgi:hypothetical protein